VSSPNYNITTYSLNDSPDLADTNGIYTKVIASILPMIVISLLFSTCAAICPESIAGEKERGTIATLLVTPVKRYEVASGKIFALSCISIIGGTFSFLGVVLSLPKIMQMSDATLSLGPLQYILMFLVIISCVVMIVSVMSLFSCFAKSIKEANSMISISMPVVLVFSLLAAFIKNNSLWITIIPIYNVSTALTQLVNNQYNGIFLALTISSNIAYSLIFGYLVVKMFNSERIMFSR
jgi:sodium transport system permease protein